MRRFLVRDVNLLFPLAIVLAMGILAALGWHRSVATQRSREATQQIATEARMVDLIGQSMGEAERVQLDYLLSGADSDFLGYQAAVAGIDALSSRLVQYAAADRVSGGMLRETVKLVGARQAVLAHEAALRRQGLSVTGLLAGRAGLDVPHARQIQDRLLVAAQMLEHRRQSYLDVVSSSIRTLRWLAVAVAALGAIGVLSVFRLLSRAWRRLIQAETQQRMIAMQLRGSLDSLSQGVAVFGADGHLLNWNMRLGQMLDLPPALLRRGLPYDSLGRHLAGDGPAFLESLSAIRADSPDDGELRPVVYERAVQQHTTPGGRQPETGESRIEIRRTLMPQGGFVLTLTDITERARGERMLHEAQKMQALGQLTGGIAHDFNNMLTVILGSLDVSPAQVAAAGDQQVAMLTTRMRRAAQAAESGAALTRRLLTFARKQPLAPAPVDLGGILPDLVPLLRHTIGEGIKVRLVAEPGLWPAVTDAAQLESAVLNLALNARDAMPDGGSLSIEAGNAAFGPRRATPHPDLAAGEYVRISVADTGHGMSQEVIDRAFEPFFSTKSEGRGTGLGLAMVFGFARQSGGLATIHSEPGLGTTVTLYLPRALANVAANRAAPEPEPASVPRAKAFGPRILLVEDDVSVREIAADVLRELGYRVSEAPDAEQALRILDSREDLAGGGLSLLLTDIALPGAFDGRALAACVRQKSPATRVLYMSGHPEDRPSADGNPEEQVQWLGKPFRRAQLASKVDALIGMSCADQAA